MINKKQIEVYKHYEGYIEMWVRIGTKEEKEIISGKEWYLIVELLRDIANSKEKEEDIRKLLEEKIEDKEVIDELMKMAMDKKDTLIVIPDPINLNKADDFKLIDIVTFERKYHKPETIAAAEKELKRREKKGTLIWEHFKKE